MRAAILEQFLYQFTGCIFAILEHAVFSFSAVHLRRAVYGLHVIRIIPDSLLQW